MGTAPHGKVKMQDNMQICNFECYLQVCVWNNLEMKKKKHRTILKATLILGKKKETHIDC